jgi:hypothetical protein
LSSWGTTAICVPFTEWSPCVGVDAVQAAMILAALSMGAGSAQAQLAYQTAPVRVDNPDVWAAVPSGLTVSGSTTTSGASSSIDVSSLTAGKAWIRFGVLLSVAVGGTPPAVADVTLAMANTDVGAMVGNWRGQLVATVTSDAYMAVTGWTVSLAAQKVMAAIIVASASTNFRHRLVYRVAPTMQAVPGAWTDIATEVNQSGNLERNTGRLALTLGANLFVQFGLAYSSSSGTSVADVQVSVGARRT